MLTTLGTYHCDGRNGDGKEEEKLSVVSQRLNYRDNAFNTSPPPATVVIREGFSGVSQT